MFDWYKIFEYEDFIESGLVSQSKRVFLEGIGFEEILITKGVMTSVLFRGVFLPLEFNGQNPYSFGGDYSIFKDPSNSIWIGVKNQ
jgi:hypothetical protein